jgi:hypothetical protein
MFYRRLIHPAVAKIKREDASKRRTRYLVWAAVASIV